jgi:hypothetical protein
MTLGRVGVEGEGVGNGIGRTSFAAYRASVVFVIVIVGRHTVWGTVSDTVPHTV